MTPLRNGVRLSWKTNGRPRGRPEGKQIMNIGFIDYYLDEWHANHYPEMILRASSGEMRVSCAYAMIDSPLGGMTTQQWCEQMRISHCATVEEVVGKSDALVVLSPDNCEMHEILCQVPLRSGKRTYVDKTFAPDGATARRLFALANYHGTPCYSTSALRFATEYQDLALDELRAINSWGPNRFDTYAIHQLEPIMMLMQAAPRRVMGTSTRGYSHLLIEFCDGRIASLANFEAGAPFEMSLCTAGGSQIIRVATDFFVRFIEAMVRFFQTGTPEVGQEETVAIMDVLGAGRQALAQPGRWIDIAVG